jgi:hypothetical protein
MSGVPCTSSKDRGQVMIHLVARIATPNAMTELCGIGLVI